MRRVFFSLALIAALAGLPSLASAAEEPCPKQARCFDVTVPLDRTGVVPGTIDLPVVVEKGSEPLMLILGGGPGQGMTQYAESIIRGYGDMIPGYRFAVLDQRGTGRVAINCPSLQKADLNDLTVPPLGTVEDCGRRLGETRGFYTTVDTVADLEQMRVAIGVPKLAVMGTSYGTYSAMGYAVTHPDRVSRLILDSVVPQNNVQPFFADSMRRAGVVLKQLCKLGKCRGGTRSATRDLFRLVKRMGNRPVTGFGRPTRKRPRIKVRIDGPALFDSMISLASFMPDELVRLPGAMKGALAGRNKPLLDLMAKAKVKSAPGGLESLSSAAHIATLCGDIKTWPWGGADTPVAGRLSLARQAAANSPRSAFYPFDRKTAAGNGALVQCARWPRTTVPPPYTPSELPPVPTLVFAGGWDLSTPLADSRREAQANDSAVLVVAPYTGHGVFGQARCSIPVMRRFLKDKPVNGLCDGTRPPYSD